MKDMDHSDIEADRRVREEAAAFLDEVFAEFVRARRKFPQPNPSVAALTEEVGELARAVLSRPLPEVRAEATQVAAMALRIAVEGDPTLDPFREAQAEGLLPSTSVLDRLV
ncbi:MAG: hypothetical protein VYD87_11010 [Pseudomonadota bacterium]|nr:hypothetical protein [Pseudomonadota bacterium]MEE3099721.1 hypothetical protein [Pseudomonadota bacterium]